VLIDDFTTNTVSPNGTGIYNWYPVDGLTAYSIANNTLTISSDNSGVGAGVMTFPDFTCCPALSAPGAPAANTGAGVVYQYGYFEASLSFNPDGWTAGTWPAFWMGHATDGPSNPDGNFDEIDIFEGIPVPWPPAVGEPAENSATLHEWTPSYAAASPPHGFSVSQNVDFTKPNTFGLLWTPTSLSIYLNNQLQSTLAIGLGTPYPSAAIDFNSVILGTGSNWPITFYFVHIWQ